MSKHRKIYETLVAEIAAGTYDAAARVPSEAQLVRRFGVSRPTIARAMRDLQQEGLLERRIGSGRFLLKNASVGANSSVKHLGILAPNAAAFGTFRTFHGELASVARANEYSLVLGGCKQTPDGQFVVSESPADVCRRFIEHSITGVFFLPFESMGGMDAANREIAERLHTAGVCVVLLDHDIASYPRRSSFDVVAVDNLLAGYLSAEHLLRAGSRNLVYVARPNSSPAVIARAAGAREALAEARIEIPRMFLHTGDPTDLRFVRMLRAIPQLDAMVCSDDIVAAQLIRSMERLNVKVPADLRIVGCGDMEIPDTFGAGLTTISRPSRELAVNAMRVMLDRLANPMLPPLSSCVTPHLIIRESCGTFSRERNRWSSLGSSCAA